MCPGRPAYRRPKGRKGGSSRPKFKAAEWPEPSCAIASRAPTGKVKARLLEARVPSYLTSYPYFKWEALG